MQNNVSTELIEEAVAAALRVREHAYAPYSRFHVGAALIDGSGAIHVGCNVENASYGLTNCAERAAVATAIGVGSRNILICVVVTDTTPPSAPCGACRQVLFECNPKMNILMTNLQRNDVWCTMDDLLPRAFGPTSL